MEPVNWNLTAYDSFYVLWGWDGIEDVDVKSFEEYPTLEEIHAALAMWEANGRRRN